jgi:uncharacterized membrane protein (UPF0127 family)
MPMQRDRRHTLRRAVVIGGSIGLASFFAAALPRPLAAHPKWAVAIFPSGAEFSLEIAADDETRRRGYMFRESVGPKEGMLFLFTEDGPHGMWMKNCKAALDIIWLDRSFRVVDIAERLQPCPQEGPCPSRLPLGMARYVLEVAAGRSREEGLKRGDRLVILSEPALP